MEAYFDIQSQLDNHLRLDVELAPLSLWQFV